jgi:hypothetical protein
MDLVPLQTELDNAELCNPLNLVCRQCHYVATWVVHARNRTVLVHIILCHRISFSFSNR